MRPSAPVESLMPTGKWNGESGIPEVDGRGARSGSRGDLGGTVAGMVLLSDGREDGQWRERRRWTRDGVKDLRGANAKSAAIRSDHIRDFGLRKDLKHLVKSLELMAKGGYDTFDDDPPQRLRNRRITRI